MKKLTDTVGGVVGGVTGGGSGGGGGTGGGGGGTPAPAPDPVATLTKSQKCLQDLGLAITTNPASLVGPDAVKYLACMG